MTRVTSRGDSVRDRPAKQHPQGPGRARQRPERERWAEVPAVAVKTLWFAPAVGDDGGSPGDRELEGEAPDGCGVPAKFVGGYGKVQAGEAGEEGVDRDVEFGQCKGCGGAVVSAPAECHVWGGRAVGVEYVGVREDSRVAVRSQV